MNIPIRKAISIPNAWETTKSETSIRKKSNLKSATKFKGTTDDILPKMLVHKGEIFYPLSFIVACQ